MTEKGIQKLSSRNLCPVPSNLLVLLNTSVQRPVLKSADLSIWQCCTGSVCVTLLYCVSLKEVNIIYIYALLYNACGSHYQLYAVKKCHLRLMWVMNCWI